ncbi:hypothetical protein MIND_00967700 [Mycena indigotica]|uniref:Uncharacterized protein n=1 Tax=Mycena indigotica TaxID=2126181 RepID=A0A8H6SDA2_9AGAR|nr:uncharacterized protein MIND_00967700 [Mycena indigotica]KAF7297343.1 hypothetical protein MIND_00967700 [Mycena indigotica]
MAQNGNETLSPVPAVRVRVVGLSSFPPQLQAKTSTSPLAVLSGMPISRLLSSREAGWHLFRSDSASHCYLILPAGGAQFSAVYSIARRPRPVGRTPDTGTGASSNSCQ